MSQKETRRAAWLVFSSCSRSKNRLKREERHRNEFTMTIGGAPRGRGAVRSHTANPAIPRPGRCGQAGRMRPIMGSEARSGRTMSVREWSSQPASNAVRDRSTSTGRLTGPCPLAARNGPASDTRWVPWDWRHTHRRRWFTRRKAEPKGQKRRLSLRQRDERLDGRLMRES